MDFDAGNINFAGAELDGEHADIGAVGGDDLPVVRVEPAGVIVPLGLLVPSPDRGDVVAHGGFVQLEAELAVGGHGGSQRDDTHAASCSWAFDENAVAE
jgi:hypothetical protein